MTRPVTKIIIVGGGSAGWLTAGIIASQHCSNDPNGLSVTLIESSDIPTIGVGEGTWPTMRETLASIGISELEFINCCDATFKQGSQFVNWSNQQQSYYHPFVVPKGFGQTNLALNWQAHSTHSSFAHTVSFQPHLCDANKAPKQIQTPDYAAVANYGYHLNAGKFAELLKQHCINKLGVKHIDDKVCAVKGERSEPIQAVATEQHGDLSADLYIDCSGQHALLINKHYQIPLHGLDHILFNDRAVAVQVPYSNEQQEIASHTIATAHDFGWTWDIGLQTRRGVGNVYSSKFNTEQEAEKQLAQYLSNSLNDYEISDLTFRHIQFTPGYRKQFWHHNCVAVGMAAGFIEPLEASALALIELSAKMIAKELPANNQTMPIVAKRFNDRFEYRWQRIVDFLKLHYVLSERSSEYWQAHKNTNSVPASLTELLTLWQYQEPTYNDLVQIEEVFPAASYQYVLYGMGFKTEKRSTKRQTDNSDLCASLFNENRQMSQKFISGLPSNRQLINQLQAKYNNN